jgi:hypothetical protein
LASNYAPQARLADGIAVLGVAQRQADGNGRRIVGPGTAAAAARGPAVDDNRRCGAGLDEGRGIIILPKTARVTPANNAAATATASSGVARTGEIMRVANAMAFVSFFMGHFP